MRNAVRGFWVLFWSAVGAVGAVLVVELLLEALPVGGKGIYAADPNPEWPVAHMIPDRPYVYSAGWNLRNVRRGTINNMGYVAPFDYVPGSSAVIVLGDSFVESLMNPYDESLQGVLAKQLHEPLSVMQFGVSAASMADYLGLSSLIAQRFDPKWAVLLITEGDFTGGFGAGSGYFRWDSTHNPSVRLVPDRLRSPTTKFLRQLALVRYLRYNLKVTPSRFLAPRRALPSGEKRSECEPVVLQDSDAELVRQFVRQLPHALSIDPSHVVLIFDSDREAIYAGARAPEHCPDRDSEAQKLLRELASSSGMHIVETRPLFADFYARTHRRLDYSPVDGHWNPDAHRLVATEVARIINGAP
jgi:hypothetical protein